MKLKILIFLILCGHFLFSQSPTYMWGNSIGGANREEGRSLAIDKLGNVYVVGDFETSTIILGSDTLINQGDNDVLLVKYDNNGNFLWVRTAAGTAYDNGYSVACDEQNNVIIGGTFISPSLNFGTTVLSNTGSGRDIFIAKYDPSGNLIWAKKAGGSGDDQLKSISSAPDSDFLFCGRMGGSATFGSLTMPSGGFVVKCDSLANVIWSDSGITGYGYAITSDSTGNTLLTGIFNTLTITFDTIVLSNTPFVSMPAYDVYVVKYDLSGNVVWAKSCGGSYDDTGFDIVADSSGNVIVCGSMATSSMTFGSYTLVSPYSSTSFFTAKYDLLGNFMWAKTVGAGTNVSTQAYGLDTDINDNIFITGTSGASGTLAFGAISFPSSGSSNNVFILKYNSAGIEQWADCISGNSYDVGNDIKVDPLGDPILVGTFQSSSLNFGSISFSCPLGDFRDIFVVKVSKIVSISEVAMSELNFVLYPNPSAGVFYIENEEFYEIEIFNEIGEKIYDGKGTTGKKLFDLSDHPAGIYCIRMTCGERAKVEKIVIGR